MESGANISESIIAESPALNYQVGFNIDILNWSFWLVDATVALFHLKENWNVVTKFN